MLRKSRYAALVLVAAMIAVLFPALSAPAAEAAPMPSSCGYANVDGGGKYPGSICWLDFAGYDPAIGVTPAGQEFEMSLGEYDVSFSVTQRPISGWTSRSVVATAATTPPFLMGGSDYYQDIPGRPFLYATSGAQTFGAVQIAIENFEVTLDGVPVTGYELVSASPETPDAPVGQFGEWINWSSDQPLTLIDHRPLVSSGGGCTIPLSGDGTTNVWCSPALSGTQSAFGAILSAPSATRISGSLYMSSRGEREALGFGIRTARVTLNKDLTGRVSPDDSVDLSVTASEGPTLATATTGDSSSATTGPIAVIPSGPITLAENATTGSDSPLNYYDAAWACTNATTDSSTTLPDGTEASQQVALTAGDVVTCGITNTPRSAGLSLVKSVAPTTASVGDTVVYEFLVSNTGQLPVDGLVINESSFSGSGDLGEITCPVTSLDPGEVTTCEASYTATQSDVDAGIVLNEATAAAQVADTDVEVDSNASSATLTTGGSAALAVAKTVDHEAVMVGDVVEYTLTATNTGSLTLRDVTLTDVGFTGASPLDNPTCDRAVPVVLEPQQALTCTVSYTAELADVGTITNEVAGAARDPQGNELTGAAAAEVRVTKAAFVPPETEGKGHAGLPTTGIDAPVLALGAGVLLVVVGVGMYGMRRTRRH